MERSNNTSDIKYNALIDELVQGMEKANQLKLHLHSTSLNEAQELLLQRTINSYEKALMILNWGGSDQRQAHVADQAEAEVEPPQHGGSSIKVDGSPQSDDRSRSFKDSEDISTPKKRKLHQPIWTHQVRVNSENGLEGPTYDGFSWRKYGQKDILGATYPRSYYRCTYRALRNCWATKQVQRSDEDPSLFEITYKGTHSCNTVQTMMQPLSEEKEAKHEYGSSSHNNQPPQEQHNLALMNLKSNLRVNVESEAQIENVPVQFSFPCQDREDNYFPIFSCVDDDNYLGAYASEVFVSPATSASNYFSSSAYQVKGFEGLMNFKNHENSDIAEVVSGHASTSNSPIGGIDFASETSELNPNFRF